MPVGVPKIHVVYDSKGNILVKRKKKRFDDDAFGEKFAEELGADFGADFGANFGAGSDSDSDNELVQGVEDEDEDEDEEEQGVGKGLENEKKVGQASELQYEDWEGFRFRNKVLENEKKVGQASEDKYNFNNFFDSQKQVCFEDDDKDDNALEAAEKRKKKEEEEEEKKWDDLFEILHREGVVFVGREMTMKFANCVVSLMVYLDREDNPTRTPNVFINSPGGFVFAGLAIYDSLNLIRYGNKVQTFVIGIAASMASVVLIGGGIRVAFINAKVMIHQPRMKPFEDEASEIGLEARVLLDLRHIIIEIYERKTTKPYWIINRDLECDKFMTADDAQAYGIVDVLAPRKRDDDVFDDIF